MQKKIVVVGETFQDALRLIKVLRTIAGAHKIGRVRGVHSGAVAVVLWACGVNADVVAAAAAVPGIGLRKFLDTVLPQNAADRTERGCVTVVTAEMSWAYTGKLVRHTRWMTRDALIECVAVACKPTNKLWPVMSTAGGHPGLPALCRHCEVLQPRSRGRGFGAVEPATVGDK
ncbi:MAG: hypothetical protein CL678_15735 [Bdellovibrionaceae bacterium]|nr:hypothetical protein [Pseudobdellovibrionaceae bacterium]